MLGGKQKHSRLGHRRRQVAVAHPGCRILVAQSNHPFPKYPDRRALDAARDII